MEVEEYYNNYQLGIDIWKNKYQYEDETFDNWLDRVSGNDTEVRQLIVDKKFLFGGRILANRGIEGRNVSFSNCYTNAIEHDSIDGIYKTAKELGVTFARGGGIGTDLSALAPRGAEIGNAAKTTSGAVSFVPLFDTTCELIGSEGRRAALLLALNSEHPDLEEFVDVKTVEGAITKANLSVMFSDKFMKSVINNEMHTLSFTRANGSTIIKEIDAKKIFQKFCHNNWDWSEPGALFMNRIHNWNLQSNNNQFQIVGVNACSEIPLTQHAACLLASINLSELVINGELLYDEFAKIVRIAIRALDGVLTEGMDKHPLQEQKDAAERFRQLGLGVMGAGDAFIKMGIIYGSQESLDIIDTLGRIMINAAIQESAYLARDYGVFPAYDADAIIKSAFYKENLDYDTRILVDKYGIRNATLLGVAPTGTLSTMLNITGGIEPMYATSYTRKTESLHGEEVFYDVYPNVVSEYMSMHNISNTTLLPEEFITAKDINSSARIDMQSIWQQYIDGAISSTINLPNEATVEDVYNIYVEAWQSGLKGVTVHRDGNKREGVLTEDNTSIQEEYNRGDWEPISDDVVYYKKKVYTGCGQLNLFIGYSKINNKIEDLYIKRSGNGSGCVNNIDAFIIAASGMLRLGGDFDNVKQALQGLGSCNSFTRARLVGKKLSKGANCGTAILNTIDSFNLGEDLPIHMQKKIIDIIDTPKFRCPQCNEELIFSGGCIECKACGYSKCD